MVVSYPAAARTSCAIRGEGSAAMAAALSGSGHGGGLHRSPTGPTESGVALIRECVASVCYLSRVAGTRGVKKAFARVTRNYL